MRQRMMHRAIVAVALSWVSFGAVVRAGEARTGWPERSLWAAIPKGVYLSVAGRHNPERDFLEPCYREIWDAVEKSGVIPEAARIFREMIPPADLERISREWDAVKGHLEKMRWGAFIEKEFAMGVAFRAPFSHMLLLFRMDPGDCRVNGQAIGSLLKWVSGMGEAVRYREGSYAGATTASLDIGAEEVVYGVHVAIAGDVLVIGTAEDLLKQSLDLLGGEGESFLAGPGVREAFSHLPEPEDSAVYLDAKALFRDLRGLEGFIRSQAPDDDGARLATRIIRRVFSSLDVLEYVAMAEFTEGTHFHTVSYTKMNRAWEESPLYPVFGKQRPLRDAYGFIPEDAEGFSVSEGLDVSALYRFVLDFLREELPQGEDLVKRWDEMQQGWEFNLDRDLLSLFDGATVSYTVPSKAPNILFGGGQDQVMLARLRDADRARKVLDHWLGKLVRASEEWKAAKVVVGELPGGLKSISLTIFPFVQPVVGVREGMFVFATSPAAAEEAFRVQRGERPNVLKNRRFIGLGVLPYGSVCSMRYTDLEKEVQMMAQTLAGVGIMSAFMVGLIPDQERQKELKPIFQILGLLPRLAPIVQEFDFLDAQAACATYDPETRALVEHSVISVKAPPPGKPAGEIREVEEF